MKSLKPAWLFICIVFLCIEQAASQRLINVTTQDDGTRILFADALSDSMGVYSISDVCSENFADKFRPGQVAGFSEDIKNYWFRFTLQNNSGKSGNWLLNFDNWAYVKLYSGDSLTTQTPKISGHLIPFLQKDYASGNRNLVKLYLKAGETVNCYARLETSNRWQVKPADLSFRMYTDALYLAERHDQDNTISWFNGFFMVILLYNLFIFLSTKDKNYIPYLLMLLFNFIFNFENFGYNFEVMKHYPAYLNWYSFLDMLLSFIYACAILSFAARFLKVKQHFPFFYKFFMVTLLALFILVIVSFMGNEYLAYSIGNMVGIISMLSILIVAIRSFYIKLPSAGYFLLAQTAFLTGLIIFLLKSLNMVPNHFLTNYSLQIGSAVEELLFSFALANRINVLEKDNKEKQLELIDQLHENQNLQKELNIKLEQKVVERTQELQQSLQNLKATQVQLIHSEKMASLGELTAGIAHEIQNPLNFVNNFSDINAELIDELKQELAAGNLQVATEIADDIKENEAKINHHGKRADGIVKGMLQHSRSGTGDKEPTDINKLADEYLRLSYHGLRSKDKDFNADIKTAFDESTGFINAVPQDIGRVLLNLFNNAFYALNEKAKLQITGYKPQVIVTTKKIDPAQGAVAKVEISVADNGNGIPEKIKEKIFQPFFTTKPTGSGTGLGLSLSYDIIKAHGGQIIVDSAEGEGTTFIIVLPA